MTSWSCIIRFEMSSGRAWIQWNNHQGARSLCLGTCLGFSQCLWIKQCRSWGCSADVVQYVREPLSRTCLHSSQLPCYCIYLCCCQSVRCQLVQNKIAINFRIIIFLRDTYFSYTSLWHYFRTHLKRAFLCIDLEIMLLLVPPPFFGDFHLIFMQNYSKVTAKKSALGIDCFQILYGEFSHSIRNVIQTSRYQFPYKGYGI